MQKIISEEIDKTKKNKDKKYYLLIIPIILIFLIYKFIIFNVSFPNGYILVFIEPTPFVMFNNTFYRFGLDGDIIKRIKSKRTI